MEQIKYDYNLILNRNLFMFKFFKKQTLNEYNKNKIELKKIGFLMEDTLQDKLLIHGEIEIMPIMLVDLKALTFKNTIYKYNPGGSPIPAGWCTLSSADANIISFDGVFEDKAITMFQNINKDDTEAEWLIFEIDKKAKINGFLRIQFNPESKKAYQLKL